MQEPDNETISFLIKTALVSYDENRDRTQQARGGTVGPSDIGFCRQKAVLVTKGVQPSDSKSIWPAQVGTAIHDYTKAALSRMFPAWYCDNQKVTATLPGTGAQISGTPDVIIPEYNLILDAKTVDGYQAIMQFGPSLNHRMQRHMYAMGAIDAGLLDPNAQVYVGNVYLDRSGKESDPLVLIEPFDDALTQEIDSWVEDVIYAVRYGEDASRDVSAPVCEKICEFYSVCRGSLPMQESEPITDPDLVNAITMYDEGRTMESRGKSMKEEAKAILRGVNGSDGRFQVRWTTVDATEVPGFTKRASQRLDVRPIRRK